MSFEQAKSMFVAHFLCLLKVIDSHLKGCWCSKVAIFPQQNLQSLLTRNDFKSKFQLFCVSVRVVVWRLIVSRPEVHNSIGTRFCQVVFFDSLQWSALLALQFTLSSRWWIQKWFSLIVGFISSFVFSGFVFISNLFMLCWRTKSKFRPLLLEPFLVPHPIPLFFPCDSIFHVSDL